MLRRQGLGLLLGAVVATTAWAQGSTRFDGQYVGELRLTKIISGDCTQSPPGAIYPMTISGGQVQFKYDPRFDTTLRGSIDQYGRFAASQRVQKGWVSMTGHVQGNRVTARIKSPSCTYTFRTRE
jgi:hypothetical protein